MQALGRDIKHITAGVPGVLALLTGNTGTDLLVAMEILKRGRKPPSRVGQTLDSGVLLGINSDGC